MNKIFIALIVIITIFISGCVSNHLVTVTNFTYPTNPLIQTTTITNVSNTTYIVVAAGGGGSVKSAGNFTFNQTQCDIYAAHLGKNCTCYRCGQWMDFNENISGFYNLSGVYYNDGSSTGQTLQEMDDSAMNRDNLKYKQYMEHLGCSYIVNKWVCV